MEPIKVGDPIPIDNCVPVRKGTPARLFKIDGGLLAYTDSNTWRHRLIRSARQTGEYTPENDVRTYLASKGISVCSSLADKDTLLRISIGGIPILMGVYANLIGSDTSETFRCGDSVSVGTDSHSGESWGFIGTLGITEETSSFQVHLSGENQSWEGGEDPCFDGEVVTTPVNEFATVEGRAFKLLEQPWEQPDEIAWVITINGNTISITYNEMSDAWSAGIPISVGVLGLSISTSSYFVNEGADPPVYTVGSSQGSYGDLGVLFDPDVT